MATPELFNSLFINLFSDEDELEDEDIELSGEGKIVMEMCDIEGLVATNIADPNADTRTAYSGRKG